MAAYIKNELIKQGVKVLTSQSATAFEKAGQEIVMEDGTVLASDVTILSVGIQPETNLAKRAGIELGHRGVSW